MTYDSPPDFPKSEDKSAANSEEEAAAEDHDLSKNYATLGVRNASTPEEVKQAYRDLTKVWHPDRFDGGDARLRKKAEEQLKVINEAYDRIQRFQLTLKQEHAQKIPTDDELIEAIEATRRRVDASTKKMEEFLEQMKRQKQSSLERL